MPVDGSAAQGPTLVALVNMPFAMADRPSIQCGLLKSSVQQAGHETEVLYLNLEFAADLGADLYRNISTSCTDKLLGEWLFSGAAFDDLPEGDQYIQACRSLDSLFETWGIDSRRLHQIREEVIPAWVERWVEKMDWGRYTIVGFTSTFEQNNASFALARRIKKRFPEVIILFGGANFDGTMGREYVRALPFIDYAVVGEGDQLLPEIVEKVAHGESPLGIRGVIGRRDGEIIYNGIAARIEDMDSLPDPDYSEYFATLYRLGVDTVLSGKAPHLLFETSRGCWWGEKQHCTFCGLNGNGMKFRSKSPSSALAQLERLSTRYDINTFEAVDNIMDYRYLEQVCRPLAERHFDYRIFYEVKANLHPHQLRVMRRAGINRIQPGIESLNSHILALMRKGITMLRNVRLLKWAHYYGMQVGWNILTGFPGERDADYEEQSQIIALIRHLPPPLGISRIWLERFSPYFFDQSFPIKNIRPLSSYQFIYPEHRMNLNEVAYYFSYDMSSTLPESKHEELRNQVLQWRAAWECRPRPTLTYQRAPNWIQIADRRTEKVATFSFRDWVADVYEMCSDTERSAESLSESLSVRSGRDISPEDIQAVLQKFCELGLMLEEKNSFLSLALPVNRHW